MELVFSKQEVVNFGHTRGAKWALSPMCSEDSLCSWAATFPPGVCFCECVAGASPQLWALSCDLAAPLRLLLRLPFRLHKWTAERQVWPLCPNKLASFLFPSNAPNSPPATHEPRSFGRPKRAPRAEWARRSLSLAHLAHLAAPIWPSLSA